MSKFEPNMRKAGRRGMRADEIEQIKQRDAQMNKAVASLLEPDGSNGTIVVLPARKKKKRKTGVPEEVLALAREMSKAKRKKLAEIEKKKRADRERKQMYKTLKENVVDDAKMQLMQSSGQLGQKLTAKQRLRQSLKLQKAGVALDSEQMDELYRKAEVVVAEDGEMTDLVQRQEAQRKVEEAADEEIEQAQREAEEQARKEAEEKAQREAEKQAASEAKMKAQRMAEEKAREEVAEKARQAEEEYRKSKEGYVPKPIDMSEKLSAPVKEGSELLRRAGKIVQIKRSTQIQSSRMKLPICSMEQEIMEAVTLHPVVVVCGETGSGKTTQIPQFLYEAGYGKPQAHYAADDRRKQQDKQEQQEQQGQGSSGEEAGDGYGLIGVTQPRRVAAISTARRVAEELGQKWGTRGPRGCTVGYHIRHEKVQVGPHTRVKFMTDGVLLKEMQADLLLRKYSVVVLDEVHERNVNTDLLLGMLSRVVPLRTKVAEEEKAERERERRRSCKAGAPSSSSSAVSAAPLRPLRVIIMSATMRVSDFVENPTLFQAPPPVLEVKARQFNVGCHFNRVTELEDYVGEAYKKVCKIHRRLPPGGVLVFLTGEVEITDLCTKLQNEFGETRPGFSAKRRVQVKVIKDADRQKAKQLQKETSREVRVESRKKRREKKERKRVERKKKKEELQEELAYAVGRRGGKDKRARRNSLRSVGQDKDGRWVLGAKIEGDFEEGGQFHPGTVSAVHENGTYDITYDDGGVERSVGADSIHASSSSMNASAITSAETDKEDAKEREKDEQKKERERKIEQKEKIAKLIDADLKMLDEMAELDDSADSDNRSDSESDIDSDSDSDSNSSVGSGAEEREEEEEEEEEDVVAQAKNAAALRAYDASRKKKSTNTGAYVAADVEWEQEEEAEAEAEAAKGKLTIAGLEEDVGESKASALLEATGGWDALDADADAEDDGFEEDLGEGAVVQPVHVVPLFARLSSEGQMAAFKTPPEGHRLVVVATNVAETSITIPNIRYVVDSGRSKEKIVDPVSGVSAFHVTWTSKASAEQRKGRAGRTGPGHCYRLYSSAVFDTHFPRFTEPEVLRRPLSDVVLHMKAIGIQHIDDFPFPSPPSRDALRAALTTLTDLGALEKIADPPTAEMTQPKKKKKAKKIRRGSEDDEDSVGDEHEMTGLGRYMAQLPVDPMFARMLVAAVGAERHCPGTLAMGVALVAGMSLDDPFLWPKEITAPADDVKDAGSKGGGDGAVEALQAAGGDLEAAALTRERALSGQTDGDDSDAAVAAASMTSSSGGWDDEMNSSSDPSSAASKKQTEEGRKKAMAEARAAIAQWLDSDSDALALLKAHGAYVHSGGTSKFCKRSMLHDKTMRQAVQLRLQLARVVNRVLKPRPPLPDLTVVGQAMLPPPSRPQRDVLRQVVLSGMVHQVARLAPPGTILEGSRLQRQCAYLSCARSVREALYIHPKSGLFTPNFKALPEFVVYQSISRSTRGRQLSFMKGVTAVHPEWLATAAAGTPMCKIGTATALGDTLGAIASMGLEGLGGSPPPVYDATADRLLCWGAPEFGARKWQLPLCQIAWPDSAKDPSDARYRWFARFLLEGKIIASFQELKGNLNIDPSWVTGKRLDKKVLVLVSELEQQQVESRSDLEETWNEQPQFLYPILRECTKPAAFKLLERIWRTRNHGN